jgi:hypothetical protein
MDIASHALALLVEKLAGLSTSLRYAIERLRTSSIGLKIVICVSILLLPDRSCALVY